MLWARGAADITKRTEEPMDKKPLMWTGSVGQDLDFEQDRAIHTDPEEINHRRTIQLTRENDTWGFTLQTYVIKNKRTKELEVTTFVDYVELNGPAHIGGLQRGSVILSVNGERVENDTHKDLCRKIKQSGRTMRLVVLTGNCTKKIELYERYLKLKSLLLEKMEEFRKYDQEEKDFYRDHPMSRQSPWRESVRSSVSSDWDRYSLMASPGAQDTALAGALQRFSLEGSRLSQRSASYRTASDSASQISFDAANDSFSDSDSSCFVMGAASPAMAAVPPIDSQERLRSPHPEGSSFTPSGSCSSRGVPRSGHLVNSSLLRGEKSASAPMMSNRNSLELSPPCRSTAGKRRENGIVSGLTPKRSRENGVVSSGTPQRSGENGSVTSENLQGDHEKDAVRSGSEEQRAENGMSSSETTQRGSESEMNNSETTQRGSESEMNNSETTQRGPDNRMNNSETTQRGPENRMNNSETTQRGPQNGTSTEMPRRRYAHGILINEADESTKL